MVNAMMMMVMKGGRREGGLFLCDIKAENSSIDVGGRQDDKFETNTPYC